MEESKVKTAEYYWKQYSEDMELYYNTDHIAHTKKSFMSGYNTGQSHITKLEAKVKLLEKDRLDAGIHICELGVTISDLEARNNELEALVKELIPIAKDGYRLHIKNACHQDFLEEDEELLSKAEQALNKK